MIRSFWNSLIKSAPSHIAVYISEHEVETAPEAGGDRNLINVPDSLLSVSRDYLASEQKDDPSLSQLFLMPLSPLKMGGKRCYLLVWLFAAGRPFW